MRLSVLISLFASASAFSMPPRLQSDASPTELEMVDRREMIGGVILAGAALMPKAAGAFSQQLDDYAFEPQQQPTDGRYAQKKQGVSLTCQATFHRLTSAPKLPIC